MSSFNSQIFMITLNDHTRMLHNDGMIRSWCETLNLEILPVVFSVTNKIEIWNKIYVEVFASGILN